MADKRCDNGHYIDESWDICPYCPPGTRSSNSEIPVIRPRRPNTDEFAQRRPEDDSAKRRMLQERLRAVDALEDDSPGPQRTVAAPKLDPALLAAVPRYVVGLLLALTGPSRGDAYLVRMGKTVIGRDRKSDVVISDEQASSHHADLVFRPEEKRFILMDHNSTNGTFVNGAEIEPRRDLANRDVIRIGSQKFMFISLSDMGFNWDDQDSVK